MAGVVWIVVSPFVMRYRNGRAGSGGIDCGSGINWSGIVFGVAVGLSGLLKRTDSLPEVEDLPKRNPEVQQAETGDGAAHPARRNHGLQRRHPGLARRIKKKVVVSPVAEAERTLRNPRQKGQEDANFQTEEDIENDTELCGHG